MRPCFPQNPSDHYGHHTDCLASASSITAITTITHATTKPSSSSFGQNRTHPSFPVIKGATIPLPILPLLPPPPPPPSPMKSPEKKKQVTTTTTVVHHPHSLARSGTIDPRHSNIGGNLVTLGQSSRKRMATTIHPKFQPRCKINRSIIGRGYDHDHVHAEDVVNSNKKSVINHSRANCNSTTIITVHNNNHNKTTAVVNKNTNHNEGSQHSVASHSSKRQYKKIDKDISTTQKQHLRDTEQKETAILPTGKTLISASSSLSSSPSVTPPPPQSQTPSPLPSLPSNSPTQPKHACPLCGKTFKRAHNLKIHGRLHNDDRPYGCPFEDCDKEFRWKSSIVSHINWHRTKKGQMLPPSVLLSRSRSRARPRSSSTKPSIPTGINTPIAMKLPKTEQEYKIIQQQSDVHCQLQQQRYQQRQQKQKKEQQIPQHVHDITHKLKLEDILTGSIHVNAFEVNNPNPSLNNPSAPSPFNTSKIVQFVQQQQIGTYNVGLGANVISQSDMKQQIGGCSVGLLGNIFDQNKGPQLKNAVNMNPNLIVKKENYIIDDDNNRDGNLGQTKLMVREMEPLNKRTFEMNHDKMKIEEMVEVDFSGQRQQQHCGNSRKYKQENLVLSSTPTSILKEENTMLTYLVPTSTPPSVYMKNNIPISNELLSSKNSNHFAENKEQSEGMELLKELAEGLGEPGIEIQGHGGGMEELNLKQDDASNKNTESNIFTKDKEPDPDFVEDLPFSWFSPLVEGDNDKGDGNGNESGNESGNDNGNDNGTANGNGSSKDDMLQWFIDVDGVDFGDAVMKVIPFHDDNDGTWNDETTGRLEERSS